MKSPYRTVSITLSSFLAIFAILGLIGCSNTNGPSPSLSSSIPQSTKPLDLSATIQPTTLIDDPSITVIADSLTFRNDNAYIELSLTNKTNSELSITCGSLGYDCNYINDYMMTGGYFAADLEAGSAIQKEAYFNGSELAMFGISEIREIGLGISIRNSDFKTIFRGPTNIRTSLYDSATEGTGDYQAAMEKGALVKYLGGEVKKFSTDDAFAQSGICIVSEALVSNADGDMSLFLQTANDSEALVNVRIANITINGETAFDGNWSSTAIVPGKQAIIILKLDTMIKDEDAEKFDLGNVRTVAFDLEAKNADENTVVPKSPISISF